MDTAVAIGEDTIMGIAFEGHTLAVVKQAARMPVALNVTISFVAAALDGHPNAGDAPAVERNWPLREIVLNFTNENMTERSCANGAWSAPASRQ